jgi:hypothetical protein
MLDPGTLDPAGVAGEEIFVTAVFKMALSRR